MALQPGGVGNAVLYNEGVLKGLDYVLSEAQKRGIKVLLVSAGLGACNGVGALFGPPTSPLPHLRLCGRC